MESKDAIVKRTETPGRGRGLVAARNVVGGEVLLREAPLLFYMEADAARSKAFCEHCVRSLPPAGGIACSSCKSALFCSSDCLAEARFSSHSPLVCRTFSTLVALNTEKDFENQARFLIAAVNLSSRSAQSYETLLQLSGSVEVEIEAGVVNDHAEALHAFIQEAVKDEDPLLSRFPVEVIRSLVVKDARNAFALMAPSKEGERGVRAYAIYPQASLLNHNCLPNSCRFDYLEGANSGNMDVIVRALHEIEEGTELCLSYFPINWQYSDRQRRLLEDYGFVCNCSRCEIEQNWADDEDDDDGAEDAEAVHGGEEDDSCQDDDKLMSKLKIYEQTAVAAGVEDEEDDFPHALFFVKYLCPVADCGGTMAPVELGPAARRNGMECNACGEFRTDEALLKDLQEHGILV